MSQTTPTNENDPRVLTPSDDEEQVIVKGAWGASGDAYHTTECRNVVAMRSVREVPLSVAEWKGYHECHVCITEGEYNDDPDALDTRSTGEHVHPTPTYDECAAFRKRLVNGETPAQVAADVSWGRTAVYTHARGDCQHNGPVEHPPVVYEAGAWQVDA